MISIDLVPVISAIIGIIGISFKAGQILQRLDGNTEDIKEIKTELKEITKRLIILESTTVRITKA